MSFTANTALISIGLFISLLAFLETGRRIGVARAKGQEGGVKGAGAVDGAVFGLLALLIAFTFSGAASRFEDRRHLINEETNAIGTAYLRLDLLNADARDSLREAFRRYLDVRIATYADVEDEAATIARIAEGAAMQSALWAQAVAESQEPGAATDAAKLLLPALNQMIDITATRQIATQNHPPTVIYYLLIAFSLIAALLAGLGLSSDHTRSWLHMTVFATVIAGTLFVVLDLERPRTGLIRIDSADQALIDLRESMR